MTQVHHPAKSFTDERLSRGWSRRSLLAAALTTSVAPFVPRPVAGAIAAPSSVIIRGMSLPSWQHGTYHTRRYAESLLSLADMGFTAVAISPNHAIASAADCRFVTSAYNESFDDVALAVEQARKAGLDVLLEPRLTVFDCTRSADAIDPSDTEMFFDGYGQLIRRYAVLATRYDASVLAIGCELSRLTGPEHRQTWLRLIDAVRQTFKGSLVYAAASDEALRVSFWDALDYIGVQTYASLGPTEPSSVETILAHWLQSLPSAAAAGGHGQTAHATTRATPWPRLASQYRKPILLTAAGVRRIAATPGSPEGGNITYVAADFAMQASFYETMMRQASEINDGWLAGIFLAGWRIDAAPRTLALAKRPS